MDDDYTEGDRWDWDQSDPRQYCKHGSFIGSSWGPDLLCGACEMGDPDITVNEVLQQKQNYINKMQIGFTHWGYLYSMVDTELAQKALIEALKQYNWEYEQTLKNYDAQIEEIRDWAETDDDNDWLSRKHDKEMELYNARS